ncbi:MAG: alpha/beta hydrolase [Candidatus Auribacter fodinae]|jgi:pimeloyl-ACP methyl ester carboxylesterase|uniref:Alpha/beta hydrolase n=1 Tax=Candidatus Auribacter fodinae TaxID=2093366 RepID=A0A3A4QVF0_9BACT|nr:MAG: alpha/beta hydrolase [Candidatus Auribacter fodinae]
MRRISVLWVLAVSLALAGCSKKASEPLDFKEVSFITKDNVTIFADYYPPSKPSPVLILLHMYGRSRQTWEPAVADWYNRGFTILSIDLRGHGQSTVKDGKEFRFTYPKSKTDNMFIDAWQDVEAGIEYLKQYPACMTDRTLIVGASIGCSVALLAGSKLEQVRGAVLMSPGTNYLQVNSLEHIKSFAPKPLLMLSDEKESSASEQLIKAGGYKEDVHLIFPEAGHGTDMFASKDSKKIIDTIGDWLAKQFYR